MAEVEVKNKFSVGDELELIMPGGNRSFRLQEMHDMDGQPMDVAPGSGYRVQIPVENGEYELGLLACNL
jgi:putative protease